MRSVHKRSSHGVAGLGCRLPEGPFELIQTRPALVQLVEPEAARGSRPQRVPISRTHAEVLFQLESLGREPVLAQGVTDGESEIGCRLDFDTEPVSVDPRMSGNDPLVCRLCVVNGIPGPPRSVDDMISHVSLDYTVEVDTEALRPDVTSCVFGLAEPSLSEPLSDDVGVAHPHVEAPQQFVEGIRDDLAPP